MLREEDNFSLSLPQPAPVAPAAAGSGNPKTHSGSVSWSGNSSPVNSNPRNTKSLWHSKVRSCLPPLSVSRSNVKEWPAAGLDDIGVWSNVAKTPRDRPRAPPIPLTVNKDECSRIVDHIFLGSDAVAKNRDVLREYGITHVLNCVGFVCPEYFNKDLVYKTLWLRDNPTEDITSIIYDVFDYFEDVREEKGRILVHCCQGVSRSTSLVIAYLMWSKRHSFEEALEQVKEARGVTNPNMGFACQLLQCQKRVHALPVSPNSLIRMFRIAPHSSYAPLHLVPKLLAKPNSKAFDSRGAFIVHVPNNIYIWVGKNCVSLMLESASLAASQVIRYEKAIGPVLRITEGKEPVEFWWAFASEKEPGIEVRCDLGEKRVVDYDLDFEIFKKAVSGGIVPPLAISSDNHETCLPARQSGWERLKRKLCDGVMKELILMDHSHKDFECPKHADSGFSFPSSLISSNDTVSKENHEDTHEYQSSESFSCFLVKRFKKVH